MCIDQKSRNVYIKWEREFKVIQLHPFPYTHTLWKASDHFIFEALFVLKIWLFGYVEKMVWLEREG